MSDAAFEPGQYLNVDLDLEAHEGGSLEALTAEFDAALFTLHRDREDAHYELADGCGLGPTETIRGLVEVIARLSPAARAVWDAARARDFNIGVQRAADGQPLELHVDPDAVRAIAALGGRVVITVYPPRPVTP